MSVRRRCQLAEMTFLTAAFTPSWASEITSFTPRSPRRVAVTRVGARIRALAVGGATAVGHVELHHTLGHKADHLAHDVIGTGLLKHPTPACSSWSSGTSSWFG